MMAPTRRRHTVAARRERGSLALEYVLVAPLFLILFALIFAFARVTLLQGLLDSATRDAARQVTQLADLGQADTAAQQTVKDDLGGGSGGCNKGNVDVVVRAVNPVGKVDNVPQPGDTVTVTATCSYTLSDLGLPLPMPRMTAHAQFSSMVDPNRSRG
jgi:Flp pilus assembly protein TadG